VLIFEKVFGKPGLSPTVRLRQALTVLSLCSAGSFLTFFPLPPLTRDLFWAPRPLIPEMDFSRYLRVMAHNICGTLSPICPSLPYSSSLSKLGCLLSFQPNLGFNNERNIVGILPCISSSALDGSREPRRDVSRTGEISKDWLASNRIQHFRIEGCIQRKMDRHLGRATGLE
jgi:hypothetical protein